MVSFDPRKNRSNLAKHGVELSAATRFEWNSAVIEEDDTEAYGEQRERAIGWLDGSLHVYVYTLRNDEDHAISLRKATKQEARTYGKTFP